MFFIFSVTNTFNTNMHDLFIMVHLGGDVVFCGRKMLGPCSLVKCRLDTCLPAKLREVFRGKAGDMHSVGMLTCFICVRFGR